MISSDAHAFGRGLTYTCVGITSALKANKLSSAPFLFSQLVSKQSSLKVSLQQLKRFKYHVDACVPVVKLVWVS